MTADNLAAVNAKVLAAATGGADTAAEVQTLVTAVNTAVTKIEAYNNGDGSSPAALVVADYTAAGVTGVTADNFAAANVKVLAACYRWCGYCCRSTNRDYCVKYCGNQNRSLQQW